MSRVTGPTDEEVGARLAQALERRLEHIAPRGALDLAGVRAGARRRRRTTRATIGAGCALALGLVGAAIAVRSTDDTTPVAPTTTLPAPPPLLPAYAMLTDDSGADIVPVSSDASRGGRGWGLAMPAIDVWQRGAETLVVRTIDQREPSGVDDQSAPTTAAPDADDLQPWRDRTVTRLSVRGVRGAIEQLGDDQFAVWIPQGSAQRYTLVIGRGMTRDAVLQAVGDLEDRDGVLEPVDGFAAVERVAAAPATTPTTPFLQLAYASDELAPHDASALRPPTWWLWSSTAPAGRTTLETMPLHDIGRIETIDGRPVVVTEVYTRRSVAWIEPSGLHVSVMTDDDSVALDEMVRRVRLGTEADWIAARRRNAAEITTSLPVRGTYTAGDVELERRTQEPVQALCLTVADTTDCGAMVVEHPEVGATVRADAEIDGHWIIAGYWEGQEDEASIADMSFLDGAGNSVAAVDWTYRDDAYWYIARIADGVDVVTTNLGNVVGGPVGQLSRPLGIAVNQ